MSHFDQDDLEKKYSKNFEVSGFLNRSQFFWFSGHITLRID